MPNLFAAAAFFVAIHLLVSGTRLRDAITVRIGDGPYMGLFSLASLGGLVWLGWAYAQARVAPGNEALWGLTEATRHIQIVLQLVAVLLIVLGLSTRNPGAVRGEAALERPDLVKGVLRISRHPFLWGMTVWAAGHLLVNGYVASLVLALFGTASIDHKRRRALGKTWDAFAAQTSNIPFLAMAQGRQRLSLGEIGWWRIALA